MMHAQCFKSASIRFSTVCSVLIAFAVLSAASSYSQGGVSGGFALSGVHRSTRAGLAGTGTKPALVSAAATQTIRLVVTNSDGTTSGSIRLGVPVDLTAVVSSGAHQVVNWSVQGPGHLSVLAGGTLKARYTPPQTMPSGNTAISIRAYLRTSTSVSTTFSSTLGNPIPRVETSGLSVTKLLSGGTQSISLVGSGFVPSTYVKFNGAQLPIVFKDYYHASVQVPVPGAAEGTLSLQLRNPGPGGGPGTVFHEAVVPNSIALSATASGVADPGGVGLGNQVTVTGVVTGSMQTALIWSVTGAGSVASSGTRVGVYTAPAAMPGNRAVTINAALASNPAITASYQLNVQNPSPTITGTSPSQVPAGATTSVTLIGTGFVPGTVLLVDNGAATATYVSATSMVAQISVGANTTGTVSLQAQNPTPGGGTSLTMQEAIAAPVSVAAAARILDQTTFGPTTSLIQHVQSEGVNAWLTEQFNAPATLLPNISQPDPSWCPNAAYECAESEWWQVALTGNDQLRQRVAFALSELFVVSVNAMAVTGQGMTPYANMLANDAFTNWYTIMKDVTLSPAMGLYLNMLNSAKATGTDIANENYARENMQLFNLGLNMLHQDGTPKYDDSGALIPVYTEANVEDFARIYTGWTYAHTDGSAPSSLIGTENYSHPMVAVEAFHDTGPKTLLNGTTVPAGQTAAEDLDSGLTNIFQHPNVPPFVSKQLIQHLVTGNPSPDYVARVAAVFTDNGDHVRGDMKSVLSAIFTDPEARAGDTSLNAQAGHLREPILWMTDVMRGLGYVNVDPNDFYYGLSVSSRGLSQQPYAAASVFNFFPPGYVIPDTQINSPEFAIENTATVVSRLSLADHLVNNKITGFNVDLSATSSLGKIAKSSADLVDALGVLFMHGQMDSDTRTAIINAVHPLTDPQERVQVAAYLVITSSEYKIQH